MTTYGERVVGGVGENAVQGLWNGENAESVAHAEVVRFVPQGDSVAPDGTVQMAWTDAAGFTRVATLVRWWRLDRQGLEPGVELAVEIQARQRRDRACPHHHLAASLVVTGDPADKAEVMIGDPHRPGSWAFGVQFHGATLVGTTMVLGEAGGEHVDLPAVRS